MIDLPFFNRLQTELEVGAPNRMLHRNYEGSRDFVVSKPPNVRWIPSISEDVWFHVNEAIARNDYYILVFAGHIHKTSNVPRVETLVIRPQSASLPAMARRLEELAKLADDWNGRGSEAPNDIALRVASSVADRLAGSGMDPSRIVASPTGGIAFYFFGAPEETEQSPSRFASIECTNTGKRIAMLSDRRHQVPDVWEVDASTLPQALNRLQRFVTNDRAQS